MKTKIIHLIVLVAMLGPSPAFSLSGLRLLTVESGARPAGMGGAFSAVAQDPSSFAYNPAAVYGLQGLNGTLGHNTHWENVSIETGYISFTKRDVTISTGLQFGRVGELQGRNDTVPSSDYIPFDAHDISFKAGASYEFEKNVILGFSLGWMFEKIDMYRGSAFNFDIGMLFRVMPYLNVGASVLNIGSTLQLRDRAFDIPTTIRAGASYRYDKLRAVLDLIMFDDDKDEGMDLRTHFGAEYRLIPDFTLRAGYRLGYESKSLSAGLGFSKRNFRIDYAFLPY
ncbi:MAG: PorV/PorQ family protein, partial [Candidatus Zixiibacteriota bacterium]